MTASALDHGFRIADIRVGLRLPASASFPRPTEIYEAFRCTESAPPDVRILVRVEAAPPLQGSLTFSSNTVWQLYQESGKRIMKFLAPRALVERGEGAPARRIGGLPPNTETVLDRLAIFEADFSRGDLYVPPHRNRAGEPVRYGGHVRATFPFSYPFDELLFISLLAQGRGMEVHGCGVSLNGDGLLFIGSSGAGKSTMGRLMAAQPGATVLSDDRIIVRKLGGRWWIYGTPWHGQGGAFAAQRAELRKVFVLRHASSNKAALLPAGQAAGLLVARSFPTYWDSAGMSFTLELLEDLCARIPVYDLGFAPTPSCVEYIKAL